MQIPRWAMSPAIVLAQVLMVLVLALALKAESLVFVIVLLAAGGVGYAFHWLLKRSLGGASFASLPRSHPWSFRIGLLLAILAWPLLFTFVFPDAHWIHVGITAGIYVCLALGLNVVVGLAGLLDLGVVAFYAIGAYSAALVAKAWPEAWWLPWLMMPVAASLASLWAVVLGFPTLRLRGDYLAIVTLGFAEIVRITITNWDGLTYGPIGVSGVPRLALGPLRFSGFWIVGNTRVPRQLLFFLLVAAVACTMAAIVARLDNSRLGRSWRAIREDELAARAMGIDTTLAKRVAFALGASFAGFAGLLFAHLQGFVSPESFMFLESANILCMVVLGGMGSIPGVILGAILLTLLPEKLRDLEAYRMLAFGAVLVAMMILRPQGLIPAGARRSAGKKPAPAPAG